MQEDLKVLTDAEELAKPLQGSKEEIRLNKEFQKKLNELSKLSGYEKTKEDFRFVKAGFQRKLCNRKTIPVRI